MAKHSLCVVIHIETLSLCRYSQKRVFENKKVCKNHFFFHMTWIGRTRTCIEGILDILHSGQDIRDEVLIPWGHDFVANINDDDFASRVESQDIRSDPLTSVIRVGSQRRNITVSDADYYSYPGVRQRLDYRRIGAVKPDFLDSSRPEEVRRRWWRREVVGYLAVVDADERLCICKTTVTSQEVCFEWVDSSWLGQFCL